MSDSSETVVDSAGRVDDLALSGKPLGTPITTEEHYSVESKTKAYDMFLHTDLDFVDIAIALGIPRHVLLKWSRQGRWNDRKAEIELEAFRSSELAYRKFLTEHRLPTIERHLKAATMIEEEIVRVMEAAKTNGGVVDSMTLRRLSEALGSAANVSARASGVADRILSDSGGGDDSAKNKKQPLVVIGIGPQLSATNTPDSKAPGDRVIEVVEPFSQTVEVRG